MIQMNDLKISGNLTRDAEQQGDGPVRMTVASNTKYKDKKGDLKEEVSFVDVVAWGPVGAACIDLPKGFPVLVEGRIKQESWEDKTTGEKRSKLVVVASRIHWLARKNNEEARPVAQDPAPRIPSAASRINAPIDDEPPF
jgi:single-strand DNA-binding protein